MAFRAFIFSDVRIFVINLKFFGIFGEGTIKPLEKNSPHLQVEN